MKKSNYLTIELINAMKRREMQQHCKVLKIRANTKNDVMRQALIDTISTKNVAEEKIVEKIEEEEKKVVPEEKKASVMSDVTNEEVVVEKKVEKKAEKQEVVEKEQDEDLVEAFENLNLPFEGKRTVFKTPDKASRFVQYVAHWTMDDYEKENSNVSPDPSTYNVHWTMDDYDN